MAKEAQISRVRSSKHTMHTLLIERSGSKAHFVFDGGLLVLVQVHLDQLGAVQLDADALAHDLGGEDQILKDGVVHSGQSPGAGTLLLEGVAGLARGLGQNLALANHDDVLARELLLQLADQDDLDLLEHLLLWNGHVDDDGLGKNTVKVLLIRVCMSI